MGNNQDDMLRDRATVAGWYQAAMAELDGVTPMYDGPQERSWFVYAPRLDADIDRNAVIGALDAQGIAAKPYLPCIHLQPFYRERFGFVEGDFPAAEAASRSTLALPFHANLETEAIEIIQRRLSNEEWHELEAVSYTHLTLPTKRIV